MAIFSVFIARDRCVGVAMCVHHAPGGFDVGDDGISVFLSHGEWTEEGLVQAAEGCPTQSIAVFRDGEKIA